MIKHAFVIVLFVCTIVSGAFANTSRRGTSPRRTEQPSPVINSETSAWSTLLTETETAGELILGELKGIYDGVKESWDSSDADTKEVVLWQMSHPYKDFSFTASQQDVQGNLLPKGSVKSGLSTLVLHPEYMRPVVNKYIENNEQKLLFWQEYDRLYNEKDGNVTVEDLWDILIAVMSQNYLSELYSVKQWAGQANHELAQLVSTETYEESKLTVFDAHRMARNVLKRDITWIDNAQEMINVLSLYATDAPTADGSLAKSLGLLPMFTNVLYYYFNTTQCTLLDAERLVKLHALIKLDDDNVAILGNELTKFEQDMVFGKSKNYVRYYTWVFDDVTESWDVTRGNSIVRTLGDLLKIDLGNSNDCHGFNKLNSTICNKLLPMAKTAWPNDPESFCYFPNVAKTIFGVEPVYEYGTCQAQLATVTEDWHVALDSKHDNDYGLESTAFCGIQVNASTGLTDQINDYIINRSGGLCWATYCSRSTVQYNGSACGQSRFNYDDIMTCNYSCLTADGGIDENNTINFVFDDLSQGGDFISRAGNSGASCIAYGGAYDGKNCRFLGRAECNALGEKYDIEVRWDAESGLCRMADSVTANYINTGIRLGVTTVVIAATGGMAGAGAGQILGAVALNVAAEGIMEEAQRELEKLPQQTAQRFVEAIEQCDCTKGKQCAQKAVEEYLGQALSHEYSISDPEMRKRMQDAINSAKTCLGDVEFAAAVRKSTPIGWEEGMVMAMGFFGVFLDGDFDSSDAAHLGAVDDITDMAMQYGDDLVEVVDDAARVGRSTDNLAGVASRSGHDFNVVGRLDGKMDDTIVVAYSNGNREFVVTVSPRSTGKIYRFDDGTEFKFIGQNGDFLQFDCPDGIIIIDVSDAKKIDTSDVVFDIWDEVDDADDGGVEIIDVKKTNDATAAVGRVDDVVDVVEGLGVKNPSYSGKWDVTSVYYNGHELPIVAKGVKSGRPIVVVKVNDMHIPFYISTGKAQKMGVPTGKWEFFGGITDSGWFRKGTEEEIVRHYDTVHLRGIAEALDEQVGDLRDVLDVERSAARAARGAEGHVATATENRSISISDINQTTKDYVVHDYRVPPTSWVKDLDSRADLYFSGGYDINALKQSASSSFDKYLNDFLETGQSVVGLPESRLDQRGWTSLDGYLRKEYSVRLKKEVTSEGVHVMKFQKNELRF